MTINQETLQIAVNIEENTGVSIMQHNSLEEYAAAFLQTISSESLDEIAKDLSIPVGDEMRDKIKKELERRVH